MDTATADAIRAFYRLHKAIQAVAADPHHPGALEALSNAAYDANAKLGAVGLLGDEHRARILALTAELFPDYQPKF
jgi:hypothetical protein